MMEINLLFEGAVQAQRVQTNTAQSLGGKKGN